jgi:hypothetical protein
MLARNAENREWLRELWGDLSRVKSNDFRRERPGSRD